MSGQTCMRARNVVGKRVVFRPLGKRRRKPQAKSLATLVNDLKQSGISHSELATLRENYLCCISLGHMEPQIRCYPVLQNQSAGSAGRTHPDSLVLSQLLCGVADAARPREIKPGIGTHWDEMHLAE